MAQWGCIGYWGVCWTRPYSARKGSFGRRRKVQAAWLAAAAPFVVAVVGRWRGGRALAAGIGGSILGESFGIGGWVLGVSHGL